MTKMSAEDLRFLPPMNDLLVRAKFLIRSAKRADCARCTGHSRGTVSYTEEVAFCHRCAWKANVATLARELGLLGNDPAICAQLRTEAHRRARFEQPLNSFEGWREVRIRRISDQYHALSRAAVRAAAVLWLSPECEPAWDTLARLYQSEARLSAAFDFLMFAKASAWLETDSTPAEVFSLWRSENVAT